MIAHVTLLITIFVFKFCWLSSPELPEDIGEKIKNKIEKVPQQSNVKIWVVQNNIFSLFSIVVSLNQSCVETIKRSF